MGRLILFVAFTTIIFSGCTLVEIDLASPAGPFEETRVQPGSSDYKVLLLDLDGLITSSSESGMFSKYESPVAEFKQRLRKAAKDPMVKAVVLRVNSPGGGVTASDIMYQELRSFREKTRKPVVACFMDVAASGGYYVSMAADKIVCHPTCITGSIGVIMQLVSLDTMLEKIGVEPVTIKSGRFKDAGSPLKETDEADRKTLQTVVDTMFERFVDTVARGRKMEREKVRKLADGRIYDALAAKDAGLVDEVGYLKDAISRAAEMAGVKSPMVVMYKRPGQRRSNIYSSEMKSETPLSKLAKNLNPGIGAGLHYLWIPGK